MKNLFCLLIFLSFGLFASAQDPKVILKKSLEVCQSTTHGYYELKRKMKYMSGPDTVTSTFKSHFKKIPGDTLFNSAFHYTTTFTDTFQYHTLYTGEEFVTFSARDSSGRIMPTMQWANDIDRIKHNYTLYTPLIQFDQEPFPDEEDFADTLNTFSHVGRNWINQKPCHHIKVLQAQEDEPDEPMKVLRVEYQFWIGEEDLIPVQYSVAMDLVMNNDTMYQFEIMTIENYKLNHIMDETPLTMASVPDYIQLKDYAPYKSPELLPIDTIAPEWVLPSLTDDSLSLIALRGQIVIIDFFYKACYPCMLALPGLQTLHEKYGDKGLAVIGIDPYDTKDVMVTFLAKRGVTYTVVLEAKPVAKQYRVSGYPTFYILDKEGRVLFAGSGYSENREKEIEEIILKHL